MIDAGLPIVQCLDILASQTENKKFRGIIRQLKDDVESGSTFTEALRKHNKIFDDLFVNMMSAGEIGGILDTILQRLSVYKEKSMKLKAKIKGAMIYPATIITVAGCVTAVLLIWVIPVFAELFSSFGQALRQGQAAVDHHRELARENATSFRLTPPRSRGRASSLPFSSTVGCRIPCGGGCRSVRCMRRRLVSIRSSAAKGAAVLTNLTNGHNLL